MKKLVNVIMGGPSVEHEVSLSTGMEMLKHLDKDKYRTRVVVITREKTFYYSESSPQKLDRNDLLTPDKSSLFIGPFFPYSSQEIWQGCDVALLALHGEFGEDGKFQGFLEAAGIPYTGSDVYSSAVGMEKITSKMLFELNGITTPPYSVYRVDSSETTLEQIEKKHGFPCFVKCPQSGSSRLMGRADSRDALEKMVSEFSGKTSEILIESMIDGEEYSCPVLQYPDKKPIALPPILIRPLKSSFFDYTAKYSGEEECEEIVPAPCSIDLKERMKENALKAHIILKCSGVSRTDMIVKDNTVYVLETNTLPGMTAESLVPKAFKAYGGTYTELLDIIIRTALQKGKK